MGVAVPDHVYFCHGGIQEIKRSIPDFDGIPVRKENQSIFGYLCERYFKTIQTTSSICLRRGVQYVTFLLLERGEFSGPKITSDEWQTWQQTLLDLDHYWPSNTKDSCRVMPFGDIASLSVDVRQRLGRLRTFDSNHTKTIALAVNYQGRADIVHASRQFVGKCVVAKDQFIQDEVSSEEQFFRCFWTEDLPKIDLTVMCGGRCDLAACPIHLIGYSELCFIPKRFLTLTEDDVNDSLHFYAMRERRHGR